MIFLNKKICFNLGLCFVILLLISCKNQKEYMQIHSTLPQNERDIRGSVRFPSESFKSPQLRMNNDNDFALGISLSGGGTRAQAFSFGVLLGLEEIKYHTNSDLLKEIDYFSTVSGGSFAAGTYFSELNFNLRNNLLMNLNDIYNTATKTKVNNRQFEEVNNFEKVSSSKWKILNLWRTARHSDKRRLQRLEAIEKDVLLGYKDKVYKDFSFNDIFKPISASDNEKPDRPWRLINVTIYPKFSRIVFLPSLLSSSLNVDRFIDIKGTSSIMLNNNLSVKYGVAASSAFPIFTPTYTLAGKENHNVELMDGGITDNFGIIRLIEVMHDMEVKKNKHYLIVDCSATGDFTPLYSHDSFITKAGNTALATVDGRYYDFYAKYLDLEIPDTNQRTLFNVNMLIRDIPWARVEAFWSSQKPILDKINNGKYITEFFYENYLLPSIKRDGIELGIDTDKNERVDLISFKDLSKLSPESRILLFEMISNVGTKLLIKPFEKQVLILAGKYTVYQQRNKLNDLSLAKK